MVDLTAARAKADKKLDEQIDLLIQKIVDKHDVAVVDAKILLEFALFINAPAIMKSVALQFENNEE